MKPKSIRRYFGIQSAPSLAFITAITSFTGSAYATTYRWQGTTDTQWTTASNWDANGIAPTGALATGHRLSVNNADAAKPCTYTAAQGYSTFGGVSGVRGLVVGSASNGSMVITGGTFESLTGDGTNTDVIGNSTGAGVLTIDGGAYIGSGLGTTFGVLTGGSGNGTLTVNSGSASLSVLTCNAGVGAVNLNGGTLSMNRVVFASGTNVINLNGGILKPKLPATNFVPESAGATVYVKLGGAIVDTDGNNVTISEPLLADPVSTGGGITKDGFGVLTLGAVSTTTGAANVIAGGLAVPAGATSWAPSDVTLAGDQLDFNLGVYNPSNAVPINTGTLTLDNTVTVNVSASNLPPIGQVKLLEYGTKSGTGSLVAGTLPVNTSLMENTVDGYYYLNIELAAGTSFTWSAASGDWDGVTQNWNANSAAYLEPALVTFPDLAGNRSINIVANVSPISTTFSNDVGNDYDFTGSAITGTGIMIKNGTGTAAFANPLTFTGGTYLNAGRIQLTDQSLSSDNVTIESGAFLTYDNAAAVTQGASSAAGQFLFGTGTLEKKGAGTLTFANGTGPVNWNFGPGALIDVQVGTLKGGSNSNDIWTSNKADLNIATGAVFEASEANVTVDALTGGGVYQAGLFGPRELRVGIDNGGGTFSGSIQSNGGNAANSVTFIKVGTGEQTLDGSINIFNFYTGTTLRVNGGILNISPTAPSVIGDTGSDVYISPNQTDVSTVNQTAGTITTRNLSIGQQGAATYSVSGGNVNASKIELAFTGPTTGAGAVAMNVSDGAQVNLNSNGNILMGQFYGRPVTVTQTGGNVVFYSDAGVTKGGTGSLAFRSASTTPTYNLNGGTLSIPAITWTAAGGGSGGGNGTLGFNGGTLQITSAAFAVPTGPAPAPGNGQPKIVGKIYGDNETPDSGAIFDNYGLNVTFAAPILHGPVGTFDGGLKVNTSVPGGSLTLSGLNTYTGNTTVVAGNTLVLADDAALAFVLEGTASNKITGAGSVTINGDFTIDTTGANLTNGNTWTLVDAPIPPGTFTSTFTIAGFTEIGTSGVHTKADGANTWTFREDTGELKLTVTPAGGYSTWISNFPGVGGLNQPGDDAEFDGTENLLEYVLNGNPTISDPGILPSLDASGANFVFTFTRLEESVGDTTQVFQYGSDLSGWTTVNITAPTGPEVALGTLGVPSAGLRTVTVTIPKSVAVGGKLFGRLKASQP